MADLEKRVESLELALTAQETTVSALVLAVANLIRQYQEIRDEIVNLIADVEADGNADAKSLTNIKEYLVKVGRFLHSLDAKNTALATVVCRQMGWDPDVMLAEYQRVVEDFGTVENLIETTRGDSTID